MDQSNLLEHEREIIEGIVKPYYDEPHRYYHNWSHIKRMLSVARFEPLTNSQYLAVLFHDIVYVPGCPNNEENSVVVMKTLLKTHPTLVEMVACGRITQATIDVASRVILNTKPEAGVVVNVGSDQPPYTDDVEYSAALVRDLDWAIFAENVATVQAADDNIRKEFATVPDYKWTIARSEFLSNIRPNPFKVLTQLNEITNRNIPELQQRYDLTKRRIGAFVVSAEVLDDFPDIVAGAFEFAGFVVDESVTDVITNARVFVGSSHMFDADERPGQLPVYTFSVTVDEHNTPTFAVERNGGQYIDCP